MQVLAAVPLHKLDRAQQTLHASLHAGTSNVGTLGLLLGPGLDTQELLLQIQFFPATRIPATRIPATRIPATRIPATRIPATRVPATRIPATRIPATRTPTTRVRILVCGKNWIWVLQNHMGGSSYMANPGYRTLSKWKWLTSQPPGPVTKLLTLIVGNYMYSYLPKNIPLLHVKQLLQTYKNLISVRKVMQVFIMWWISVLMNVANWLNKINKNKETNRWLQ